MDEGMNIFLTHLHKHFFEEFRTLFEFFFDEKRDQRFLVGKILVERPDADPGSFSDFDCGGFVKPRLLQDLNRGLQDASYRFLRTTLPRLMSWIYLAFSRQSFLPKMSGVVAAILIRLKIK